MNQQLNISLILFLSSLSFNLYADEVTPNDSSHVKQVFDGRAKRLEVLNQEKAEIIANLAIAHASKNQPDIDAMNRNLILIDKEIASTPAMSVAFIKPIATNPKNNTNNKIDQAANKNSKQHFHSETEVNQNSYEPWDVFQDFKK